MPSRGAVGFTLQSFSHSLQHVYHASVKKDKLLIHPAFVPTQTSRVSLTYPPSQIMRSLCDPPVPRWVRIRGSSLDSQKCYWTKRQALPQWQVQCSRQPEPPPPLSFLGGTWDALHLATVRQQTACRLRRNGNRENQLKQKLYCK